MVCVVLCCVVLCCVVLCCVVLCCAVLCCVVLCCVVLCCVVLCCVVLCCVVLCYRSAGCSALARLVFKQAEGKKVVMLAEFLGGARLLGDDLDADASLTSSTYATTSGTWFSRFVEPVAKCGRMLGDGFKRLAPGSAITDPHQLSAIKCWLRDVRGVIEAARTREVRKVLATKLSGCVQ